MGTTGSFASALITRKGHLHSILPSPYWPASGCSGGSAGLNCWDSREVELLETRGSQYEEVQAGNTADLVHAAHRLRGTVCYLGASSAKEAADRVEQAGSGGDAGAAAEAIRNLALQIELLGRALAPYREEFQT
jgi:hypothetical protein